MTTHVTYNPHYCDKRYGEFTADRIYNMKLFGIPRSLPVASNVLVGWLNSKYLWDDSAYLCNGAFELYPVYYKKPKAKIVTMVKELTFWQFSSFQKYKQNFIKKLFSINTGIITDTQAMKSLIEKAVGKKIPIEVVNPFCAQPFFENKPDLDAKRIIFIGSFESPNKGYNKLVEAWKILRKEDEEWELYLVGQRGEEFVKERLPRLHITGKVPSLNPYLSKCSIYVHPAYFEPFGVTVLEAMSAGLVPIVTAQTGMSEVLAKHKLQNLIVPDNSPEVLAERIKEVYELSKARKRSLSQKMKELTKKDHTEQKGLREFKSAFQRLVAD